MGKYCWLKLLMEYISSHLYFDLLNSLEEETAISKFVDCGFSITYCNLYTNLIN